MEAAIEKMEEIPDEEKADIASKISELKNNRQTLERTYREYQLKLKELSQLLDEYDKSQQISRINLRKAQLWLKFSYRKMANSLS